LWINTNVNEASSPLHNLLRPENNFFRPRAIHPNAIVILEKLPFFIGRHGLKFRLFIGRSRFKLGKVSLGKAHTLGSHLICREPDKLAGINVKPVVIQELSAYKKLARLPV